MKAKTLKQNFLPETHIASAFLLFFLLNQVQQVLQESVKESISATTTMRIKIPVTLDIKCSGLMVEIDPTKSKSCTKNEGRATLKLIIWSQSFKPSS